MLASMGYVQSPHLNAHATASSKARSVCFFFCFFFLFFFGGGGVAFQRPYMYLLATIFRQLGKCTLQPNSRVLVYFINTYTIRLLKCIRNIDGFQGQDVLRKKFNNRMFD